MLEVREVSHRFGKTLALDRITLDIGPGLHGLIGENGAGKTTLLRVITTILRPTSGDIVFDGRGLPSCVEPLCQNLGYLPQSFGLYPSLTARETLHYFARLKAMERPAARIAHLADLLGLDRSLDRRIPALSGGMLRRLGLAIALLSDPYVLMLDEPTSGLDPSQRIALRVLLGSLAAERLVLYSTHDLLDLERIATSVIMLHQGRLVFAGDVDQLRQRAEGFVFTVRVPRGAPVPGNCSVVSSIQDGDARILRIVTPSSPPDGAVPQRATLEDSYVLLAAPTRGVPA